MVLKDREELALKEQKQVLFSPRFTKRQFKFSMFIAGMVSMFMVYHAYIFLPRHMLTLKKDRNMRFRQLEGKGWLDGWEEEEDRVLQLEAYSLEDLDKLEEADLLPRYKTDPVIPKMHKFQPSNKEFVVGNF